MKGAFLLCIAAIALGQQALWQRYGQEGDRLAETGRYQDARSAYELALREAERSSDPAAQAKAWNNLGLLNRYLGNHREAREQYWRALELIEKATSPTSPEYAAILQNLAVLESKEGKLDEAAGQFRLALKIRESVLGENDPATAETLNSLAAVYVRQRRYAEAQRLCSRALKIQDDAWVWKIPGWSPLWTIRLPCISSCAGWTMRCIWSGERIV